MKGRIPREAKVLAMKGKPGKVSSQVAGRRRCATLREWAESTGGEGGGQ